MDSKTDRTRRRLVRTLPAKRQQNIRLRQGVIDADNGDGTVNLTIGGSSTVIEDVSCLAGAVIGVGNTVMVLSTGYDLLVLGELAT